MPAASLNRRPIKARAAWWAQGIARRLDKVGVTPNQVSVASVVAAAIASALLIGSTVIARTYQPFMFLSAALLIQLRLLCNLIDGLIAVEGGKKSIYGELFNELPDRVSDVLILVGAGYACQSALWGIQLGWLSASLAIGTAYIRAFAAGITGHQDYCGPMAKQQRMFVITVALCASAVLAAFGKNFDLLTAALVITAAGGAVTCVRRTFRLVKTIGG